MPEASEVRLASYKDEQLYGSLQDHLQAGERVQNTAFGQRSLSFWSYWWLLLLGPLGWIAILAWWLATVERYVVAQTDRRLLVVHVDTRLETKELWDYPLSSWTTLQLRTVRRSSYLDLELVAPHPLRARFSAGAARGNVARAGQIVQALQERDVEVD